MNLEYSNVKKIDKITKKKNISLENELFRKSIHLTSLLIPLIYIGVDKLPASLILLVLTAIGVGIDIAAKINPNFEKIYLQYFGSILRKHELKKKKNKIKLNGASWVLLAAFLTVVLLPKIVAIVALSILIISDATAAIVGKSFGKHSLFNKTWEGSTAFFLSAAIVVFAYGYYFDLRFEYYLTALIAALISTAVEAVSKFMNIDDNISIPLSFGVSAILVAMFFGLEFVGLTMQ